MIAIAMFLAATTVAATKPAAPAKIEFSTAYGECTQAVQGSTDVAAALRKCEEPARQGVPGAQYVMGALLVNRGAPADMTAGIAWLEKAIASGSPAAAYDLATVLAARSDDAAASSRGRELFKSAVCAGYPPAVELLTSQGVSRDSMQCPQRPETDFSGEWLLSLKWDKAAPAGPEMESYRITVDAGTARVYYKDEKKQWVEAKSGRFVLAQDGETATISVRDIGWDFDGKWIESWTIQLMRTSAEEAAVAYLRTVNNVNLPAQFAWRTFATFAEGTARRVKP